MYRLFKFGSMFIEIMTIKDGQKHGLVIFGKFCHLLVIISVDIDPTGKRITYVGNATHFETKFDFINVSHENLTGISYHIFHHEGSTKLNSFDGNEN